MTEDPKPSPRVLVMHYRCGLCGNNVLRDVALAGDRNPGDVLLGMMSGESFHDCESDGKAIGIYRVIGARVKNEQL